MDKNVSLAIISGNSGLFQDVDFASLNTAIESIGNTSRDLTAEEKKAGVDIVSQWEHGVIQKLQAKNTKLGNIRAFFTTPGEQYAHFFTEEQLMDLAKNTGTEEMYAKILELKLEIEELKIEAPVKPEDSQFLSAVENMLENKKWELENLKHNQKIRKVQEELTKVWKSWKAKLNKHQIVKDLVQQAAAFSEKLGDFTLDCKEKSQLAKLNITIGNSEVRTALKELLNFSNNLR